MATDEYIWVCTLTGVRGFTPEKIIEFEKELKSFTQPVSYWAFFSWYFDFGTDEALCYSTLWYFPKPWAKLEYLRRHMDE